MRSREFVKFTPPAKIYTAKYRLWYCSPFHSFNQHIPIYQYIQSAQKKKKVVFHNFVRQLDSETKKSI